MSCNTCQSKFSFLTKEIGCPNCGFSYCSKCLKYKCDIPNVTKKICGRCYNKLNAMKKSNVESAMNDLSAPNASKESFVPVDITMKLNSLENPAKPPIVMYKHTNRWDKFKKGLEPVDQQIVDRLQKLKDKEQNIPLPSIEEIKQRLALLRDQDLEANGSNNVINIQQVDTRTDQEKTNDLIQEYFAQLELASTSDSCKDFQQRLNFLQKKGCKSDFGEEGTSDDEEEIVTKKFIRKTLAEAILEGKYEKEFGNTEVMDLKESETNEDEDEKPTCVMCEQTMDLVHCSGCSDDLYCLVCFKDNHGDFEMKDHKAIRFQPIKTNQD